MISRTKGALTLLFVLCFCVFGNGAWAIYGVRISDLGNAPLPPNPIRIWGKVTSVPPVRLSDGRAEIVLTGIDADGEPVTGSEYRRNLCYC